MGSNWSHSLSLHLINSRWIHSNCDLNDIWLVPPPFYKGLTSFLSTRFKRKSWQQNLYYSDGFRRNYSFTIQDAIQGFCWQSIQAILQSFAVYYRGLSTNKLTCGNYCAISDHLKHHQTTDHCFLTKLLSLIRNNLPHITNIKYFTDGAASQYKNVKALINLACHFHDHKLTAEHNFFATSHGKSLSDGIGGTIKREVLMPI